MAASERRGTITVTIGDRAENHAGMEILGQEAKEGFTCKELRAIGRLLAKRGVKYEILDLKALGNCDDLADAQEASFLIIRNGLDQLTKSHDLAQGMWTELIDQDHDTKFYDRRRKKVLNKQARWNLCITHEPQEPDYEKGQGRVLTFADLPHLNRLRRYLPTFLGVKGQDLVAETNYYYDLKKCGIGFHGDTERKIVIGVRLGQSMNLVYQWYLQSKPVGQRIEVMLDHGDMYIMSEKAVGNDWKKKTIMTLRHAAGKHAG